MIFSIISMLEMGNKWWKKTKFDLFNILKKYFISIWNHFYEFQSFQCWKSEINDEKMNWRHLGSNLDQLIRNISSIFHLLNIPKKLFLH